MTDIKQLKAELAQAKKDLKAEVERTRELKQLLRFLMDSAKLAKRAKQ